MTPPMYTQGRTTRPNLEETMRVYRWLFLTLVFTLPVALAQDARLSTLVIGADLGDLITLDPGVSYEFSGSLIIDNLYETLVRFGATT